MLLRYETNFDSRLREARKKPMLPHQQKSIHQYTTQGMQSEPADRQGMEFVPHPVTE